MPCLQMSGSRNKFFLKLHTVCIRRNSVSRGFCLKIGRYQDSPFLSSLECACYGGHASVDTDDK